MKTYNGGSISNLLKHISRNEIYVTDTAARAIRYANAQATGEVNPAMDQELAEGAVLVEVEASVEFRRRPADHNTLDTCEAVARDFQITKVTIRFHDYDNTVYGTRWTGYKTRQQVIEFLVSRNIEVEVIN